MFVRKNAKKRVLVLSHIRLSAWNNSATTGWIFMKFYICGFLECLSGMFKFR